MSRSVSQAGFVVVAPKQQESLGVARIATKKKGLPLTRHTNTMFLILTEFEEDVLMFLEGLLEIVFGDYEDTVLALDARERCTETERCDD